MQLLRTLEPITSLPSFFAAQWEHSLHGWFYTNGFHHCSRWDCSSAAARLSSSHQRASAAWEETESFSLAPQLQTRQTPWWIHTVRFTKNINCRSFFIVSASCLSLILATLHWFPSFTVFIMLYNVTIHESVHCSLGEQHTIIFVKDSSINST